MGNRKQEAYAIAQVSCLVNKLKYEELSDKVIDALASHGTIAANKVIEALSNAHVQGYHRDFVTSACCVLEKIKATHSFEILQQILKSNMDGRNDWAIIGALAVLNDQRSVPLFVRVIKQDQHYVGGWCATYLAFRGLVSIGFTSAPYLRELISDDNSFVREEAANSLGEIVDTEAIDVLIHSLDDKSIVSRAEDGVNVENNHVAEAAAKALEKILQTSADKASDQEL